MKRVRVRIYGDVQGVFFRDTVRREASAAGVAGWVRNCPDGTVEAVLEGEEGAVERLVEVCRSGPPRADVQRAETRAEDPEGLSGFEVR